MDSDKFLLALFQQKIAWLASLFHGKIAFVYALKLRYKNFVCISTKNSLFLFQHIIASIYARSQMALQEVASDFARSQTEICLNPC